MVQVPYINVLPDAVICDIDIYADDTNLYPKHDQISDLWQQLELACQIESDLHFNSGKAQLVLLDQSNNTGAIDVRIDGSVLEPLARCRNVASLNLFYRS